ncbi:MAG: hypothetical protein NTV51_30550, partial [Verrucomicrobia bacterium]|nr:hypothetical protein [Verrucomicrobiota bacterium]
PESAIATLLAETTRLEIDLLNRETERLLNTLASPRRLSACPAQAGALPAPLLQALRTMAAPLARTLDHLQELAYNAPSVSDAELLQHIEDAAHHLPSLWSKLDLKAFQAAWEYELRRRLWRGIPGPLRSADFGLQISEFRNPQSAIRNSEILIQSDPAAVRRLARKVLITSTPDQRSAFWEGVPLQLRETAFFSAGVSSAELLQTAQDKLLLAVQLEREKLANGKLAFMDRRSFSSDLRELGISLGLQPPEGDATRGTIQDITSLARTNLIWDVQSQHAENFGKWKSDQFAGALDENSSNPRKQPSTTNCKPACATFPPSSATNSGALSPARWTSQATPRNG